MKLLVARFRAAHLFLTICYILQIFVSFILPSCTSVSYTHLTLPTILRV